MKKKSNLLCDFDCAFICLFQHISFVERLADLPLRKQVQCCEKFHCPLCFTFLHKSASEVKHHLVTCHWKYRVEIQAMSELPRVAMGYEAICTDVVIDTMTLSLLS